MVSWELYVFYLENLVIKIISMKEFRAIIRD